MDLPNGYKCIVDDCIYYAIYSGDERPLYCDFHYPNPDAKIKKTFKGYKHRICIEPSCQERKKRASFNYEIGMKQIFCEDHKQPEMINVISNKCKECKKNTARYCYKKDYKKATLCRECRDKKKDKDDIVDCYETLCDPPRCWRQACFGYNRKNKKEWRCKEHKKDDMTDAQHMNEEQKCLLECVISNIESGSYKTIEDYFNKTENQPKVCQKNFRTKGQQLSKKYGGIVPVFQNVFPLFDWETDVFSRHFNITLAKRGSPSRKLTDGESRKIIIKALTNIGYSSIYHYNKKEQTDKCLCYDDIMGVNFGQSLWKEHRSVQSMLCTLFPTYIWKHTIHWNLGNNKLTDDIKRDRIVSMVLVPLGYDGFDDYFINHNKYKLKWNDILDKKCSHLLVDSCMYKTFQHLYPSCEWKIHMFNTAPRNFYKDSDNMDVWVKSFKEKYSILTPEDCYRIQVSHIMEHDNGVSIFSRYFESVRLRLCEKLFPEYEFKGYLFDRTIQNTWKDPKNRRKFMDDLAHKLGLQSLDDYYNLRQRDVLDNGGDGMIVKYYDTSIYKCLRDIYPEKIWDRTKFSKWNCESEFIKWITMQFQEYEFEPIFCIDECKNKRKLPFDIGSHKYSIILEVDGDHHFRDVPHHRSSVCDKRERDIFKMSIALEQGFSIIRIPDFDIYHRFDKVKVFLCNIVPTLEKNNIYFVSSKTYLYNNHVSETLGEVKYNFIPIT